MALRKQKKYNWKETNLAYFGSELEKQVRLQGLLELYNLQQSYNHV